MLNEKWIPTSLVLPQDSKQIPIKESPNLKFRAPYVLLRILALIIHINWLRLTGKLEARDLGVLLRNFFESLGILWIKIAQILSMRMDLLPKEICEELAHLQDKAAAFSFQEAVETIESQLKQPLETVFSEFSELPFAAASTAQVHRALLKNEQKWVAVKVQRPKLQALFNADMKIMQGIATFMEFFKLMPWICWSEMMWEINQIMCEELDYRYEATNMRRMKKILKAHNIYVPKLFRDYSTTTILVMEFVQGVLMSDYLKVLRNDPKKHTQWLQENDVDPEVVGKRILQSYWRQVYEENLFHADLHSGNIILLRANRIVFIDFGSVGSTELGLLRKYESLLDASVARRYSYSIDLLLMMVRSIPPVNISDIHDELSRATESWEKRCYVKKLPYDERSFSQLNDEWTRIMFGYGIYMNTSFLRLIRSFTNMDGALRELMPRANVHKQAQQYIVQKNNRKSKKIIAHQFKSGSTLSSTIDTINTLSEQSTFRIDIIRRMAQMFESSVDKFSRLTADFFSILFILSLITLFYGIGVFTYQHHSQYLVFFPEQWRGIFTVIQPLDELIWLVVIILITHINFLFLNLRRCFSRKNNPISN
jgi:ubiquinone biosynthesis protein